MKLQHTNGWLGATAAGDFGRVEGWIRIDDSSALPVGLAGEMADRKVNLWGKGRDGEIFCI